MSALDTVATEKTKKNKKKTVHTNQLICDLTRRWWISAKLDLGLAGCPSCVVVSTEHQELSRSYRFALDPEHDRPVVAREGRDWIRHTHVARCAVKHKPAALAARGDKPRVGSRASR
jgi:hypothetical protein